MKIVNTDNYDREYPDESFVAEGIKNQEMAEIMADALNKSPRYGGDRYYKVVPDDYILIPGF